MSHRISVQFEVFLISEKVEIHRKQLIPCNEEKGFFTISIPDDITIGVKEMKEFLHSKKRKIEFVALEITNKLLKEMKSETVRFNFFTRCKLSIISNSERRSESKMISVFWAKVIQKKMRERGIEINNGTLRSFRSVKPLFVSNAESLNSFDKRRSYLIDKCLEFSSQITNREKNVLKENRWIMMFMNEMKSDIDGMKMYFRSSVLKMVRYGLYAPNGLRKVLIRVAQNYYGHYSVFVFVDGVCVC